MIISCPFSSLIEAREFKVPVLSVPELFIGLDSDLWDTLALLDYELSLSEMQKALKEAEALPQKEKQIHEEEKSTQLDLLHQNKELVHSSYFSSLEFFNARGYRGLEYKKNPEAARITMGKVGIPVAYEDIKEEEKKEAA